MKKSYEDYAPIYYKERAADPDPVKNLEVAVKESCTLMETASHVLNKYGRANNTLGNNTVANDFFALAEAFQQVRDYLFMAHHQERMYHINASLHDSAKNINAILLGVLNMKPGDDVKTAIAVSLLENTYDMPEPPEEKVHY